MSTTTPTYPDASDQLDALVSELSALSTPSPGVPAAAPPPPMGGRGAAPMASGGGHSVTLPQGSAGGEYSSAVSSFVPVVVNNPSGVPGGGVSSGGVLPHSFAAGGGNANMGNYNATTSSISAAGLVNRHSPSPTYSAAHQHSHHSTHYSAASQTHMNPRENIFYSTPNQPNNDPFSTDRSVGSLTENSAHSVGLEDERFKTSYAEAMVSASGTTESGVGVIIVRNVSQYCGGFIGTDGRRWCTRHPDDCNVAKHERDKAVLKEGIYVRSAKGKGSGALLSPYLTLTTWDKDPDLVKMGQSDLTKEVWEVMFRQSEVERQLEESGDPFVLAPTPDPKRRYSAVATVSGKKPRLSMGKRFENSGGLGFEDTVKGEMTVLESKIDVMEATIGSKPKGEEDCSLWDSLANLKAENSQLARVAGAASAEAKNAVNISSGMTMQGVPSNPTTQLVTSLQTQVSQLSKENQALSKSLQFLIPFVKEQAKVLKSVTSASSAATPTIGATSPPTSSDLVTKAEFLAQASKINMEINRLSLSANGIGAFTYGNITLASIEDCRAFVRQYCPKECLDTFYSPMLLLCTYQRAGTSNTDSNANEVAAQRLGRTTNQQDFINARKKLYPSVFKAKDGGEMSAVSTPQAFDAEDGYGGIANAIKLGIPTWGEQARSNINTQLGGEDSGLYPVASTLAFHLLEQAMKFVDRLLTEVKKVYTTRLTNFHGYGVTPSSEARADAWKPAKRMLEHIFQTISKVNLQASHFGSIKDPVDRSAAYLWVSVQEHQMWSSFAKHTNFSDHTAIHPVVVQHMEENLYTRHAAERELGAIRTKMTALEGKATQNSSSIARINSSLGNMRDNSGGRGGGGRGKGGKGAPKDEEGT